MATRKGFEARGVGKTLTIRGEALGGLAIIVGEWIDMPH